MTRRRDGWTELTTVLAAMPSLWRALLAAHIEVGGRCAACTVPGTGMPGTRWPCALHQLASRAADKHRRAIRPARPRKAIKEAA